MAYQVLARKWRPRTFDEVVGQKHVLQALINALNNNRLHHAYLFSGTRGVGKTTLGRIFAKSLNCESGVSAEPCGACNACLEIDQGRFVDLLEVDAASRTKVDETRELLENVQYSPTRGRFKVYLIDEVHMLTTHSFNALLKTLEEPPPHVKFILATTDPQKLPVTILSRCLKFNLKAIPQELIVEHMQYVLQQEAVPADVAALKLIARSATGSMRDALSLLDQAIAHGNGEVLDDTAREMLGTIDNRDVIGIVGALIEREPQQLLDQVQLLAGQGVVFSSVLSELVSVLHLLALAQLSPAALDEDDAHLLEFAKRLKPEDIQLYYQIALLGQKDLPLAPDPRAGFEMVLMRMFAFLPDNGAGSEGRLPLQGQAATGRPIQASAEPATRPIAQSTRQEAQPQGEGPAAAARALVNASSSASPSSASSNRSSVSSNPSTNGRSPTPSVAITPAVGRPIESSDEKTESNVTNDGAPRTTSTDDLAWESIVNQLPLVGLAKQVISNSALVDKYAGGVKLKVDATNAKLLSPSVSERIQQALKQFYGEELVVKFEEGEPEAQTPAAIKAQQHEEALSVAVRDLESDPNVIAMKETFDATLDPRSVKLVDKDS